jgi:myo-inositol-1(or 4)-monophosphatase
MSVTVVHVAENAARAAGEILLRHFRRGVALRSKAAANFVTDADLEAEHAIAGVIRHHFPHHEILAEEAHQGSPQAEHLWVVDPLDGTHNFAHQIPHFAVSIAYYRAGRLELGVVHDPVRDDWYRATLGGGAFHNGRPARVSQFTRLDEVMLACGFPYDRGVLMEATLAAMGDLIRREIHGIRRMGTASLDICWVGLGRFSGFFEYLLSPWDFAAGQLFVEEAGGRVTNCLGDPLRLARSSVLASNGPLHDAVLEVVRRHSPGEAGA